MAEDPEIKLCGAYLILKKIKNRMGERKADSTNGTGQTRHLPMEELDIFHLIQNSAELMDPRLSFKT